MNKSYFDDHHAELLSDLKYARRRYVKATELFNEESTPATYNNAVQALLDFNEAQEALSKYETQNIGGLLWQKQHQHRALA